MSKRYVLSSSEFKTKKQALARIQGWKDSGDLKKGETHVYEVTKKFRTRLCLEETELK